MRDDELTDKITRVTFGRGSIKEGADVTAYINLLESNLDACLYLIRGATYVERKDSLGFVTITLSHEWFRKADAIRDQMESLK
jgi:hypothetical protein